MPDDSEGKGVNRRLLLMSAWTTPVVASFALGGLASAASIVTVVGNIQRSTISTSSNLTLDTMSRTSNVTKTAPKIK